MHRLARAKLREFQHRITLGKAGAVDELRAGLRRAFLDPRLQCFHRLGPRHQHVFRDRVGLAHLALVLGQHLGVLGDQQRLPGDAAVAAGLGLVGLLQNEDGQVRVQVMRLDGRTHGRQAKAGDDEVVLLVPLFDGVEAGHGSPPGNGDGPTIRRPPRRPPTNSRTIHNHWL
ncbi:hypothetical protein D3C81_1257570 [compost metagenome]